MEKNDEMIKQETIRVILDQVTQKLKENKEYYNKKYYAGLKKFQFFNRIQYIESSQPNEVRLLYPLKKGTYGNCLEVTINPSGEVNIQGVETGEFYESIQLDNWQEPDTMNLIREKGIGKYVPDVGVFDFDEKDNIAAEISSDYGWEQVEQRFPRLYDEENEINGSYTNRWYGEGLPKLPCVEYYNEGTDLLAMTPEQATRLLKAYKKDSLEHKEDTVIYADVYFFGSSDCYDITVKDVDMYVVDNVAVVGENEQTKKEKYEEYKSIVLDLINSGIKFDYRGIINEDLINDQEFHERVNEILGQAKQTGKTEWCADIRKQIDSRLQDSVHIKANRIARQEEKITAQNEEINELQEKVQGLDGQNQAKGD